MTPVSTERLKEILAGCEGAQGGPWKLDKFACYVWAPSEKGGDFPIMDDLAKDGRVGMLRGWGYYTGHGSGALGLPHDEAAKRQRLTGEHVANCDPATVSAIVSELLSLRASPTDGELVEFRKPDKAFEAWRDTLPDKHWAKHDLSACRLGWDAALALSSAELTEWRAAGFENGRWIARAMTAESALSTAEARALERAATDRAGIYFASKTTHAARWRMLRDKVGFPIISTWIDEAGQGESQDLSDLWQRCISEASKAEVFVLNREPGEVLKGGWIELGAALSAGVPVLAVGIEEFTVARDKRIRHFLRMADVTAFLKPMVNGVAFSELTSALSTNEAGK